MILIAILIAMLLEYYHKIPESNRRFILYHDFAQLVEQKFKTKARDQDWLTLLIKLLAMPILLALFLGAFDGVFFWLISFVISTLVLIHCLGPEILRLRYEHYFTSIKRGDYEAGFLSLGEALGDVELKNLPRAVTQVIFTQVNSNYFAVLLWFIILGAPGALFYRLLKIEAKRSDGSEPVKTLAYFIDWIPSRLLAIAFALVGNFQHAGTELKHCLANYGCPPDEVIFRVGMASITNEQLADYGEFSENRHAIDLMERALLAILVFTAFLTMAGFLP